MKKLLLLSILSIFLSCSKIEKIEDNTPFKSGEEVYLKIDTTRAIIIYDVGRWDDNIFVYCISYKNNDEIVKKFVLSSELFKK